MSEASDPAFIVQIRLAGKWTTALRLPTQRDEARARRTMAKLAEAGHYEEVRILKADGLRDGRTAYRLAAETGPLAVTNPVPQKLEPKPRFRIERRYAKEPWEHAKDLPTRDDAFALALRYHRQDPHCAVRVLEEGPAGKFTELMHRKPSLGSGAEPHRHVANENHAHRSSGMIQWLMTGNGDNRRRNMVMIVACFVGLIIISRNEINAQQEKETTTEEEPLTGLVAADVLEPEMLAATCATPPALSVKFFESITVPAEEQTLLDGYLHTVRTVGSDWQFREARDGCYITLTGGAPSPGENAPTTIDCRIGDFFFTIFERPAAARAAPDGCRIL